jgi:hypothetical protein
MNLKGAVVGQAGRRAWSRPAPDDHLATLTVEVNYFGTIGSSTSVPMLLGESRRDRGRDAKDPLVLLDAP